MFITKILTGFALYIPLYTKNRESSHVSFVRILYGGVITTVIAVSHCWRILYSQWWSAAHINLWNFEWISIPAQFQASTYEIMFICVKYMQIEKKGFWIYVPHFAPTYLPRIKGFDGRPCYKLLNSPLPHIQVRAQWPVQVNRSWLMGVTNWRELASNSRLPKSRRI